MNEIQKNMADLGKIIDNWRPKRAGQTFYYDWNGIPVQEKFDKDGLSSKRFSLRDGKWIEGVPTDRVLDELIQINHEEFKELLSTIPNQPPQEGAL